jgi:hypothetical protein
VTPDGANACVTAQGDNSISEYAIHVATDPLEVSAPPAPTAYAASALTQSVRAAHGTRPTG